MSRQLSALVGAALLLVTVAAPVARADTFDLNGLFCNCIPAGSTGGTVTLTLGTGVNGTAAGNVRFAVHLFSPLDFHATNGFDAFGFSYAGAGTLTALNITPHFAFFTTPQGNGSMDGSGHHFTDFLDYTGVPGPGNNTGVTDLAFDIHGSAGAFTLATMRSGFEITNGNKVDFSAAVSQTGVSGCTGVIGGGYGTGASTPSGGSSTDINSTCGGSTSLAPVPEPSSVLLLGSAGLGMGLAVKRRFGPIRRA